MLPPLPYCYKGNNISLMTTLAWLRQRCHRNKGNSCHCNNGKDACTSTATTPSRVSITIATTVKMPAHQRQQCHHNKDDNTSFTTSNESNDNNLTTTEMSAHQQWQWHHHDDGKDTCINKCVYHGADSAAILLEHMRNRFLCVCCSGGGRRLLWNWLSGDQSPLNQFHLDSFLSFCPPKLPLCLVCVCRSAVGRRLIWNWLRGDQSPLNQFHLDSFLSFCPPKLPLSLVSSSQNCPP